jgi:hypothetical protein
MDSLRSRINLVVDTLTFHIENEWFLVVPTPEGQFLLELFVTVWSEHHINGLSLPREQSSTLW